MIPKNAIGVYGVGTMGRGICLNLSSKGHRIAIFNKEVDRVHDISHEARCLHIDTLSGYSTVRDFMNSLETPKKVLMMVPAGNPVDEVISSMKPYLQRGDILIDGGNEYYERTESRQYTLDQSGIRLVGMGISGGAKGARYGAACMPGGDIDAVKSIMPFVTSMSDPLSRATYIGRGGAGHFVKTVHNGIEYAIMQILAEVYDIMKNVNGMSQESMISFFQECNEELDCYLIDITCTILAKNDGDDCPLVEKILDVTRMNGTGVWTAQDALRCLISCPSIMAAIDARIISSDNTTRKQLSQYAPQHTSTTIEHTLYSLKVVLNIAIFMAYLQGFELIQKKSSDMYWNVDVQQVAAVWMGGCIIRSTVLGVFELTQPCLYKRYIFERFSPLFHEFIPVLISTLNTSIQSPVLNATYQYILSYTRERSPANLIQAQRDFFGSHGYERIDAPGKHTTHWE